MIHSRHTQEMDVQRTVEYEARDVHLYSPPPVAQPIRENAAQGIRHVQDREAEECQLLIHTFLLREQLDVR